MENEFYKKYLELGGSHNYDDYCYYLNVFLAITCGQIGSHSPLDRDETYFGWVYFIGDEVEASLYFNSVDMVSSYS